MKSKNTILTQIFQILLTLAIVLIVLVSFYPLLWMFLNSFKSNNEIFQNPLAIPSEWNFRIFEEAWRTYKLGPSVRNSIVVTACVVVLNLLVSAMGAYATSHLKFIGKKAFLTFCISCQIVSAQVLLIPLYKLLQDMNIYNTHIGLILSMTAFSIPMSIYLLHGFFSGLPKETFESAKIDGCSNTRYFFSIVLPLSTPIIATVTIFQALNAWNEFTFSLTFLRDTSKWTLQLLIKNMFQGHSVTYGRNFAALSIAVLPILLIYIAMQKYFIRGLTAGAIKG